MEPRTHGAPASSPACAAPPVPHPVSRRTRRPADEPCAGRPTHHARPRRRPVRTPALQNSRALTLGTPDPWSAGVLAGPRRTLRPSRSLLPTAPHPWSAGVLAGPPRTLRPSHSLPPNPPHPWSAGVLAGLRRTPRPSHSLPPNPPPCRRTVGRVAHAPCPPAAVAGEDTGAPELARPDLWNSGPMERRRPRRPAPHPPSLTQSPAEPAALPTNRGPGGPWTMPACGGGR